MMFPASARWWLAGVAGVSLAVGSMIAAERSSTAMSTAATKFLAGLTPEQRQKAALPFEGDERFKWHFVPAPPTFERKGLLIKDMNEAQRKLAHDLLKAGLSQRGYLDRIVDHGSRDRARRARSGGARGGRAHAAESSAIPSGTSSACSAPRRRATRGDGAWKGITSRCISRS